MPDLIHSLHGQDLGHLRIVAEQWGLELKANDVVAASRELAEAIVHPKLANEMIESLNPEARQALSALRRAGGRIPWAAFARQFGDVREMGAGKRDREKPYRKPTSAAEGLFYRGLLGRAFFDTASGPQEFAYVPDDWLPLLQHLATDSPEPSGPALGRAAVPAERARPLAATDRILDDATTWLAARRIGHSLQPDPVLERLLEVTGLLKHDVLQAEKVKAFFEIPRPEALRMLVEAWRSSREFDELRLVPGLVCEGEWENRPLATRQFLLGLLKATPTRTWWSLSAFVSEVKAAYPDFQRPAGDYDSWFIRSAADGSYLRGFSSWDQVDGALIRFLITGVMHRLGLLDLASPAESATPTAFRISANRNRQSEFPSSETGKLHISSQGKIAAPRLVPRAVRYQLARFCEWDEAREDEYRYHISPQALERATKQGLKVDQLVNLLAKNGDAGIPSAVAKALRRWETAGTEARTETQVVLRVSRPEILRELRKSKAAKYLGEPLGPTTVIIKSGAHQKVAEAMIELGLLVEDKTDAVQQAAK